jgi:hypothetical protein
LGGEAQAEVKRNRTITGLMMRAGSLVGFSLFSGCQDSRVTNLEQRVNQLESKTRELESERTKSVDEDASRRTQLEACVEEVSTDFQRSLVSNGTKQRNGSYNVPVPTLAEMERQKQVQIETCHLLYSK